MEHPRGLRRRRRAGRAGAAADAGRADQQTIVTTHRHADHWQALGTVAGATGAQTVAHPLDAPSLPVPPERLVDHGDTVEVGQVALEVIHQRGHTPGSIALLHRDAKR